MVSPQARADARSELSGALKACRGAFIGAGLMTATLNVLYLTSSFFMLEIYDRVIPSRSVPTLVGLVVLAATLFAFQGSLDILRGRILVRVGAWLDRALRLRVYDALVRFPLKGRPAGDAQQPIRDLDQVRAFLSGLGPAALFDLPWMPLYLAICFAFHPLIGVTALAGGILLLVMTLLAEAWTRQPTRAALTHGAQRSLRAEASRRNAEVIQAMGMAGRLAQHWDEANSNYLASQRRTSDVAGGLGSISKVLRMALQSAVMGVGAYLVIEQQATAGIIIASSILTSRALAPVETAIANWKGFVAARQSWRRLTELLAFLPPRVETLSLPAPRETLHVEAATAAPPGVQRVVVENVSFALKAGNGLGIVGPSASGKSSLARMLVGVWRPMRGNVRLDGATLDQWSPEALGPHVGYLPQDIELFSGTVAQNIARFAPKPDAEAVIAAAKAAGVHDMVLRLADGYETQIGDSGINLSAGQRQRIGLARALYGDPFLVVLDEPNSNLDVEGENALAASILSIRARGGIVIVIAHRASILAGVDLMLVMAEGRMQAFGPKDQVMGRYFRGPRAPVPIAPAVPMAAAGAASAPWPGGLRVVGDTEGQS
ncbi:MAG: type I secretion system permease/ATPase [Methylobacteriaceae bacterium]|nr:type I secretion system permease/ATPase [Methylobacteriaceae bacterium]